MVVVVVVVVVVGLEFHLSGEKEIDRWAVNFYLLYRRMEEITLLTPLEHLQLKY
jgi:hypothetical protein